MGVCCIVFDFEGMLFEFFIHFLNIEKNQMFTIFFSIFHVFFAFHAISNIKKKIGVKKNPGGGGGVEKQFFLISRFMLFSTLEKNIETPPSVRLSVRPSVRPSRLVYWLNGRWFLQIVDRDSWNLYPLYPLFPCSDFVSQLWGWFGGGDVMFFSHFMLFPTFLEKKSGNTKQLFLI